jgi:hypothetical protein
MTRLRAPAVLVILYMCGCGSVQGLVSPQVSPTSSPTDAVLVLLNGTAAVETGSPRDPIAARAGDHVARGATLLLEPGSAALLRLPGGSTVEVGGPESAKTVGGTTLGSSFRLVGATLSPSTKLALTVFGRAEVVDVVGTEVTLYAGVAVVRAQGDARFSIIAVDASHGDATVSVTKGSVTVVNTESDGQRQPQTLTGGQQLFVRAPRGH